MKIILENTDDLNKCGIYKICCTGNNKFYIGSTTKSFKQRFSQHKSKLKNNKHSCQHLQAAYNLYGKDFISDFDCYKQFSAQKIETLLILAASSVLNAFRRTPMLVSASFCILSKPLCSCCFVNTISVAG